MNQEAHLERCLASLHAQSVVQNRVEIIVVDNGSASLPLGVCSRWSDVKLLQEPIPGPGAARNTGVSGSIGDILAFIDADCVAEGNWLSQISRSIEVQGNRVVGGDVRVNYVIPDRPTFLEPYESIYSYRNDEHIAEGYSGSGNLAVARVVFDRVGPFAGIGVAEDYDWGIRATRLGFSPTYDEDMIVYHPARTSFSELARKWDRHIAHEFARKKGAAGWLKWILKALALPFSCLAEIPTILRSNRVSGYRERLLALVCLVGVRTYRAKRMFQFLFNREFRQAADFWNRH